MGEAVVFYCVAAGNDALHQFGVLLYRTADAEKTGLRAKPRQDIQHLRSDQRIGAIIKGQGQLFMVAGSPTPNGVRLGKAGDLLASQQVFGAA